jgi:hypothetical protein
LPDGADEVGYIVPHFLYRPLSQILRSGVSLTKKETVNRSFCASRLIVLPVTDKFTRMFNVE